MQIILVSPPDTREAEPAIVTTMFEQGLKYFHLRKPEFSQKKTIRYLEQIPEKYHSNIILHNQFELADYFSVKGIHFNSVNINNLNDYKQLPGIRSCSVRELDELFFVRSKINYTLLSPSFMNILQSEQPNVLHSDLLKLKAKENCPKFVALGGISAEKISKLKQKGFWGAAILSDIWHNTKNSHEMLQKMETMLALT